MLQNPQQNAEVINCEMIFLTQYVAHKEITSTLAGANDRWHCAVMTH
jgi:hypothetical protein